MKRDNQIRVLVIDAAAFSRKAITRMLEVSPLIEVVAAARNGEEALRKTLELEPDLITLDLEMPRMAGFTFLRAVMAKRPTPIIVVSSLRREEDVFKALDLGAVDFVAKPTASASSKLYTIEKALILKVHAIREMRIEKVSERIHATPPLVPDPIDPRRAIVPVVVIGSSTGGPPALAQIFGAFMDAPPCTFLVAQHMPSGFTKGFAERLNRLTSLRVREAVDGEELEAGTALLAPGACHLELEMCEGSVVTRIVPAAESARYVPSVDRLFTSAAKQFGENLLAVVLTGMGDDGRQGACEVKAAGGRVIAESEETAVIYGMPKQVVNAGAADRVLPLQEIPAEIQNEIVRKRSQGSDGGGRS